MSSAWALPLLIVMQTRSASVSPRPVAWAAQSPRPAQCLAAPGLWEVSRQALVERRCRELSRAQALLLRAPEQALARVSALVEQAPDLLEARLLRGRANLRVGKAAQALADLSPLLEGEAARLADPGALLDGGRAALALGDLQKAARFYRKLGGGAALLPSQSEQVVAYIEIAAALLASETASSDEVLAYLREARRRSSGSGYTGLTLALSALTWIAQGREAEGQGALSELGDASALARFEKSRDVWLPEGLLDAVLGLSLERRDAEQSAAHYRALGQSPLGATALGKLATRHKEAGKRGPK